MLMDEKSLFSDIFGSLQKISAFFELIERFTIKGLEEYKDHFQIYATLKEFEAVIDETISVLVSIEADITSEIAEKLDVFLKRMGDILKAVENRNTVQYYTALAATQLQLKKLMATLEGVLK